MLRKNENVGNIIEDYIKLCSKGLFNQLAQFILHCFSVQTPAKGGNPRGSTNYKETLLNEDVLQLLVMVISKPHEQNVVVCDLNSFLFA